MTITNLNVFQSGTLASVTPVNENFETLRVGVNTLETTITNNRTYLDGKVTEINTSIANSVKGMKTAGEVFCVNKGPIDAYGTPIALCGGGTTFGCSTNIIATNIDGETFTPTSIPYISLDGYADGLYHAFLDKDGGLEVFAATIYRQKTQPSGVLNNIWLDTSSVPLKAKRYTASGWADFLKVPVGYVIMASNSIQTIVTFPYNQNGYNINRDSIVPVVYAPDFSKGVGKANNVNYYADSYGWAYVYYIGASANATGYFNINGVSFPVAYSQFAGSAYGAGGAYFVPIPVGSTYSASGAHTFTFYPAITY